MNPRCFYIHEHLHKGKTYREALEQRGYKRVKYVRDSGFVLLDHDVNAQGAGRRAQVVQAYARKIPLFIYPHSSRPNVMYDIWRPWKHTKASFVIAEGHAEVLRRIDYPCPIEIVGWTYTDIKPFVPSKPIGKIKVLFAPLHPLGDGFLHEIDREINFKTYKMLLGMEDIDLTVRYINTLERNKIWDSPNATMIRGKPDGTFAEIEEADIIISAYTHAYMAVALGKPLIMMGERTLPHAGNSIWTAWSEQWEKYKTYMEYPFNIEDVVGEPKKALKMIYEAMRKNANVEQWKKIFIGEAFDPNYFVTTLETYL